MPRTGDTRHLSAIELAISTDSGGKGSVWFDDLTLTPLELESPFAVTEAVAASPLVGTWELVRPDPGGSNAKLDFGADGSFRTIVGTLAPFRYSVAGDKLNTDFGAPKGVEGYRFVNRFRISDDTFTQTGDNLLGRDLVMKRVGAARTGLPPILGVWTVVDFTGSMVFVAFHADGDAELRMPVQSCSGRWKDDAGHLSIVLNGELAERDYSIANDTLTLRYGDSQMKYSRRSRAP
jgi:hypothetical protein